MERKFGPAASENEQKIEIDIRKILEQMGIRREAWLPEWKEPVQKP